jgi:hypothetical protein
MVAEKPHNGPKKILVAQTIRGWEGIVLCLPLLPLSIDIKQLNLKKL